MLVNIVFISIIVLGTISAQLILKKGLLLLGAIDFSSGVLVQILRVLNEPYVLFALCLQGLIALLWIYVLSRIQLVYLFTVSGALFYILLALASWIVLGEKLSLIQWLGVILVSLGIICFNYHNLRSFLIQL
jgi:drug/metabolite transporter (DMT)-like permease